MKILTLDRKLVKDTNVFSWKSVEQIFANIIFLWNVWLMLKQTNPHRFIHICTHTSILYNRILFKWIHVMICITVSPALKHDDTIWNLKLSIYCIRVVDSLWIVQFYIIHEKMSYNAVHVVVFQSDLTFHFHVELSFNPTFSQKMFCITICLF